MAEVTGFGRSLTCNSLKSSRFEAQDQLFCISNVISISGRIGRIFVELQLILTGFHEGSPNYQQKQWGLGNSCSATAHLRKEFPDVLDIPTPKLTTGLLHFGYDFGTLKIFQMIRSLQHVEPFPVHDNNQEPIWVWTDGTA